MCTQCDDSRAGVGTLSRRTLLAGVVGATAVAAAPIAVAREPRTLSFYHTHTGERLRVTYAEGGRRITRALDEINHFLRDFRSGDVHPIDPELLDVLYELRHRAGQGRGTFEVISAFRSPRTNQMLRERGSAVAEGSLHLQGRALDVRLTGVRSARLRDEALALGAGGVGFYRSSDFVHVDTGRVRWW